MRIILDYSNNIREKEGFETLFHQLHKILVTVALASLESCKSRAVERDVYCVGNGDSKNAFVHLEIRLAEGRSLKIQEELGKKMLKILEEYFSRSLRDLNLQITVESKEFPRNLYFKIPSDTR